MKSLLKVALILALTFASTFVIARYFGWLTIDTVRAGLTTAHDAHPGWLAGGVILLLFLDLMIAVPTLTITVLAGYFLGFPIGTAAALAGTSAAALTGYGVSYRWGAPVLQRLVRDEAARQDMTTTFQNRGPMMIMLSRSAPILPEVTACLAGVTHMPLMRYVGWFLLGTLPYVGIAAYAGSVSTIDNPAPAIYAALGLYAALWIGAWLHQRFASALTASHNPSSTSSVA